jgi:hypothetical protein
VGSMLLAVRWRSTLLLTIFCPELSQCHWSSWSYSSSSLHVHVDRSLGFELHDVMARCWLRLNKPGNQQRSFLPSM